MTVIKKCTCENSYQDKTYGNKNRVHNVNSKGSTCTVCGDIKR